MESVERLPDLRSPTSPDGPDLTRCPQCRTPAEVLRRDLLRSTHGPVEHMLVQCIHQHWFHMPTGLLPTAG